MKKSFFLLLGCLLLLDGCGQNSNGIAQDGSNKNQNITAIQAFLLYPETASDEKTDPQNSFVPTRIFAASDFAIYLQEDGSIVYLYSKEDWNFPDFREYTCGAIIEDSAYPSVITQDLKLRIHDITAEEFDAELKGAGAGGEPVSAGTYSILERMAEEETWQNVRQMLCSHGVWYAALKKDGTVVSIGIFSADEAIAEDWSDVVQIAAAGSALYGLKADGSVYAHLELSSPALQEQYEQTVGAWQNIVQIAGGDTNTNQLFALRKDGTVVSMTGLFASQCDTWSGITAIAASRYALVGIREDGTLTAVCSKESGFSAEDVAEWKNIESVAVCDEYCAAVGSDGTVYRTETGRNNR